MNIRINKKTVRIQKASLDKMVKVFDIVEDMEINIPKEMSKGKILGVISKLLKSNMKEVVEVLSLLSDIPEEEIHAKYGVNDMLTLINGLIEVNEIKDVKKNIKGIISK